MSRGLVTGRAQAGRRLDDVLGAWLSEELGLPLTRAAVRRLVMAGAVRVDGRPLRRPGHVLASGQRLEAHVDRKRLRESRRDIAVSLGPGDILFEDPWLIAVAKPPHLAFHPTADPSRPSLVACVARLLAERDGEAAPPHLGVHQRLDRDTTGVALLVKDAEANAGLAQAFADHRVVKLYRALTVRPPHRLPRTFTIDNRLAPQGGGRRSRMGAVEEGGVPAQTEVRVARSFRHALLVEARPRTGRKHQVRTHLAGAGLPILGDTRYGGPSRIGGLSIIRLLLHASRLELPHPVTGARLVVECPEPADLRAVLEALAGLT